MNTKSKLRPVPDGEFWLIGGTPELPDGLMPDEGPVHECVDHHAFQSVDGIWQLWGCVRGTAVGRILYRWEAESLPQSPWRQTGEIIRADQALGECLDDRWGQEWLQSPFVIQEAGIYYMFYGGHGTGMDADGNPVLRDDPRTACQICLMTSRDGRMWARYRNEEGYSRLFIGPGETRDPCVIRVGDRWHMYYAGYHDQDPEEAGFYARTSSDLVHWSAWRLVHQDRRYGPGRWDTECPHVVFRRGYYYLFRTEDYPAARTHVFRSEDPLDFGIGDADDKYVGMIAVAAPEIIVDADGSEYITSNHDLRNGTKLCRLRWEED